MLVEIGFGIVVFVDLVDIGDIKRAVPVCDAGWHLHALEDGFDRPLAALVGDRVDVGGQERADITACRPCPTPSAGPAAGRLPTARS